MMNYICNQRALGCYVGGRDTWDNLIAQSTVDRQTNKQINRRLTMWPAHTHGLEYFHCRENSLRKFAASKYVMAAVNMSKK